MLIARHFSTDVRCQKYDDRMRSQARALPDRGDHIQRYNVHERSGRANVEHPEQEFRVRTMS